MKLKNAYQLWFDAGRKPCCIQKGRGGVIVRLLAMRSPEGPPPYFGNVGFEYEWVAGYTDLYVEHGISSWGTYGWRLVRCPNASLAGPPRPARA